MLQEIRRSSTEDEGDDYEQEEPKNLESAWICWSSQAEKH
jgi:hypothetical protein